MTWQACEKAPDWNGMIANYTAGPNFIITVDVKCDNSYEFGSWLGVFFVGNKAGYGKNGHRIFSLYRSPDGKLRFIMNQADNSPKDPNVEGRQGYESILDTTCTEGWFTYQLISKQDPEDPATTNYTLTQDGIEIYSDSHPTKELPNGEMMKVYVTDGANYAAKTFHVRNFYMEKLTENDICDDHTFCPADSECSPGDFKCTCNVGTIYESKQKLI